MENIQNCISIFLELSNPNEEIRTNAEKIILGYIHSPDFFKYLKDLILFSKNYQEENLLITTLIVLKKSVEIIYIENQIVEINIPDYLLELLDLVPFEHHGYIVECFRQMNQILFDSKLIFHEFQQSVIPNIYKYLREGKNFIANLSIMKIFFKFFYKEDNVERLNSFFETVFSNLIPLFLEIFMSPEINELTAISTKIAVQIIRNGIKSYTFQILNFINSSTLCSIIKSYSRYFELKNSNFSCSLSINRHLLKFNQILLLVLYNDIQFIENVIPNLYKISLYLISNSSDMYIKLYSLSILYSLYDAQFFMDDFNSLSFLTSIIIPLAKLSDEDLFDIYNSPSTISLYFGRKNKERSIRGICGKFAGALLSNPQDFFKIIEPSNDMLKYEAEIFLLSFVNQISICHDVIENIKVQLDKIDMPPYLQISFLYLFYHIADVFPYPDNLMMLAIQYIHNSKIPSVVFAAFKLLCHPKFNCYLFNQINELSTILKFCFQTHFWKPLNTILKMFKQNKSVFRNTSKDLINEFLRICSDYVSQNIEKVDAKNIDYLSNIFETVITFLEDFDKEMIIFCLERSMDILKMAQHHEFYPPIFNFVSYFNYYVESPIEEQFAFITFITESSPDFFPYAIDIVYPLIVNPLSNIAQNKSFAQKIASICCGCLNFLCQNIYMTPIHPNSVIKVAGGLIEIFGGEYIELSNYIFTLVKNFDCTLYFSAIIYTILTSMKVNFEYTLSQFDEKILNFIFSNSIANIYSYSGFYVLEIKIHFILLLEIANKTENNNVEWIRKAIAISKSFLGAQDYSSNYPNYDSSQLLRCYPNSFDKVNEWELFQITLNNLNYFLTKDEKEIIKTTSDGVLNYPD